MRIGILTLPFHTNYGGILQAFALQTFLERKGHDVVIFQKEYYGVRKISLKIYPFVIGKRIIRKCFFDHNTVVFLESKKKKENLQLRKNVDVFVQKHIHTYSVKKLQDISIADFDAIIVGSDQIWRPAYVRKMWETDIQDAFLRFSSEWNGKRVAYAASFGVDKWLFSKRETIDCKHLIHSFNAVSVREDSGVNMCWDKFGIKATQVIDPTFLLTMNDYISLIKERNSLCRDSRDSDCMFTYVLDETPDKLKLIQHIAEDRNLKPYNIVLNIQDSSISVEERIIPPVEVWINCFRDAKFVVTDSFHGCVFSIIFRKPFIAIANRERGMSRFMSLLKILELEDHLLTGTEQYSSCFSYNLPDSLSNKIEALIKNSSCFILEALS